MWEGIDQKADDDDDMKLQQAGGRMTCVDNCQTSDCFGEQTVKDILMTIDGRERP